MSEKEMKVHEKQEASQNGEATKQGKLFVPVVDIYETEKNVTVLAELPGVNKNGVDIDLENGVLTIRGMMEGEKNHGNERLLLKEYDTGHYLRRFSISETIDQEKITASIDNGLLKVVLPKFEPAKPRRIQVQAG